MQILMLLLIIVLCNMLIYSVLSIPLYRIICTTSAVSIEFGWRDNIMVGTVAPLYTVTYSIYYFIHTTSFLGSFVEIDSVLSVNYNYFIHEMLNSFVHYFWQETDSITAVESVIVTYLVQYSLFDSSISNCNVLYLYLILNDCIDTFFYYDTLDIPYVEYISYKLYNLLCNNTIYHVDHINIYEVFFLTRCSTKGVVEFYALQQRVFLIAGETTLVFFRVHNPTTYNMSCFTVYFLYPDYLSIYFYKLQCFCFEILHLDSNEILDLPVLFYISHDIAADIRLSNKFIVYYVLFPI
jgi:cytochrome c oxidase assembly protein Cox11